MFFIILYHYENIGHYSLRCFVAFYLAVFVYVSQPPAQRERERGGAVLSWPVQGSILQADLIIKLEILTETLIVS